MDTLSNLKEKIESYLRKSYTQDIIKLIPKVNDAAECMTNIAKLVNDMKLAYAWRCIADDCNLEQSINLIYNYVSDPERAYYVAGEFQKIILADSLISSSIIAYILGRVTSENRKATHSEIIVSNALMKMTDYDIDNFRFILEHCATQLGGYEVLDISNLPEDKGASCAYTLQICVSNGLLKGESDFLGIDEDSPNDQEALYSGIHYMKTIYAEQTCRYIEKVEQILKYRTTKGDL